MPKVIAEKKTRIHNDIQKQGLYLFKRSNLVLEKNVYFEIDKQ